MRKEHVTSLLVGVFLVICSMFVGEGYTPLFAMVGLLSPAVSFCGLMSYCLIALVHNVYTWTHQNVAFSYLMFQIVMSVIGYLPLLFLPKIRALVKNKSETSEIKVMLGTATFYWLVSNSLCFTQMSGLIPAWKAYDSSFFGYLTCLEAGLPFFWHSLIMSCFVYLIIYLIRKLTKVQHYESVSFSR